MKIADLFMDLKIQGGEAAEKSLGHAQTGLQGIVTSGIAGKAAILGVMYGMEQMVASSANAGQGLMTFNAQTGRGIEMLQKWSVEGLKFKVSQDQIAQGITNARSMIARAADGLGVPAAFNEFIKRTGFDVKRAKNDDYYTFETMQKYAQSKGDPMEKQIFSEGLGLNGLWSMFAQSKDARGNATDVRNSHPNILSEGQAKGLQSVDAQMAQMFYDLEIKTQKLIAKHGPSLITEIHKVLTEVLKLSDVMVTLTEKAGVFQDIARALEGMTMIGRWMNGESLGGDGKWSKKDKDEWDNDSKLPFLQQKHWLERMILGTSEALGEYDATRKRFHDHQKYPNMGFDAGGDLTGKLKDALKGVANTTINTHIAGDATQKTVGDMHAVMQRATPAIKNGQQKK